MGVRADIGTQAPRYRSWRPAGRALHLVDLENLAGWATVDPRRLASLAGELCALGQVRDGDHMVVATNPTQLLAAAAAFDGARLLVGRGRDGADLALLGACDPDEVARRYDRLVVMSGDHAFAPLARQVRAAGGSVAVVAHTHSLSGKLARAADEVLGLTGVAQRVDRAS